MTEAAVPPHGAADLARALAGAASAQQAKAALRAQVAAAVEGRTLPELHEAGLRTLRDGSGGAWTPLALVAAALGLLREPAHWQAGGVDGQRATPALLARLDALVAEVSGLPEDRRVYLGVLESLRLYAAGADRAAFARLAEAGAAGLAPRWTVGFDFAAPAAYARPLPASFAATPPRFEAKAIPFGPSNSVAGRVVVSASADARYARAMGPGLVRGMVAQPRLGLHLHLLAAEEEARGIAERLHAEAAFLGVRLAITRGEVESTDRAFYACARFLVARQVMDMFGCALLMLDADTAVLPDPDAFETLIEAARTDQVLLRVRARAVSGYLPWRRLAAGLVFLPDGASARAYLDTVSSAVGWFWRDDGTRLWWIDQLALEAARIASAKEGAAAPVGSVPIVVSRAFPPLPDHEKRARLHDAARADAAPVPGRGALPPAPLVRTVAGATLVPPGSTGTPGVPVRMAILDAAGAPVPEGDFLRRGWRMGGAEPGPVQRHLEGRHVYGGILFGHFGHFLIESLSRAWFLRRHPDLPVLWHRRGGRAPTAQRAVLELLGLAPRPGCVLDGTVTVEQLLVPRQAAAMGVNFEPGQAAALGVLPARPRSGCRIWLSRARLPEVLARIEGEAELEARLAREGWLILAPETLDVVAQLQALGEAEEVAGFMGSAFHLLLLLDGGPRRVRLLDRGLPRHLWRTYEAIAEAKGFAQEILAVEAETVGGAQTRSTIRLPDPSALAARLLG
jgi:hypothetical protein